MAKVRITETGVFDSKDREYPVGKELEIEGDTIPPLLINKCVLVVANEGSKTKSKEQASSKSGVPNEKVLVHGGKKKR